MMFYRKTTPPPEVTILDPETDINGFLTSNTFSMNWEPSVDPFIAGYTWNLQFLGSNENAIINTPPSSIMGTRTNASYVNQDNGIWAFTVAAIDQAGNIGHPSSITFRTNKFIPYTSVSYIDAVQDEQGVLSLRIIGRGFSTNGIVTTVILEQENRQYVAESFQIFSDREIGGITFDNLTEGRYRVRIEHSVRGWYTVETSIATARTRTIKFGDYSQEWRPSWIIQPHGRITINPVMALAVLLAFFSALGLIVIIRGIGGIITESAAIKQEALSSQEILCQWKRNKKL
jgi:hypothetical protein